MVEADGLGLDGGGAREPVGRAQLVDVVAVVVFGVDAGELGCEGGEAAEGCCHGCGVEEGGN